MEILLRKHNIWVEAQISNNVYFQIIPESLSRSLGHYGTLNYSQIQAVRNDDRINMKRCSNCGTLVPSDETCIKHATCESRNSYVSYNKDTIFELRFPNGLDYHLWSKKVITYLEGDINTTEGWFFIESIGTYDLHVQIKDNKLSYFRLSNSRQTITFVFDNGIMYSPNYHYYGMKFGDDLLELFPIRIRKNIIKTLLKIENIEID